ncbi:MAG: membrane protein insertase YidC [Bacteroidota bacterium]|nr:membrane protein insertase YidC [Bacteroidota bacterium]
MDRNTVLGFVLIGAILFAYSWFNKPSDAQLKLQQKYNDSIALVEKQRQIAEKQAKQAPAEQIQLSDSAKAAKFGSFAAAATGTEKIETLQNDLMEVKISNKGGRIYSVRLKKYKTFDKKPLYLFNGNESSFNLTLHAANNQLINTGDLYFTPILKDSTITMRLNPGGNSSLDFVYTIRPKNYMMKFDIVSSGMDSLLASNVNTMQLKWSQRLRQQEKGEKNENKYANLYYKYTTDEVDYLSDSKDDQKELPNKVKWIAYKDQFFSSVLIAQNPISSVNIASRVLKNEPGYIKQYDTDALIEFNAKNNKPISFSYYFGPNHYPTLKKLDKGVKNDEDKLRLDKLVPLGAKLFRWINQWIVIPLFNFFEKYISNYGLIILLLTLVIKTVLFPLTFKSYISSAKMRVLRPQVEELNEKYPGQDKAMEKQRATMDLYKKVGVNPMSGCLPMLLQMPILIAMYMFFPSSIELRQQSFLWATDLSTYDSIFSWSTQIPVLSQFYGNHISLFCLLMTATNIVYTKFNMEATNTGQAQMPGMKTMMYLMPVMFLFVLNQFASGLSYYYFISTLITILQTLAFRKFINEEKLLAKLHANAAKKPAKKKSSFMARIEEAQKRQQEIVREQQKQRQKRK